MTRTINHRLINQLRHALRPLPEDDLVQLYQEPDHLYHDLDVLRQHRLVSRSPGGYAWAGS